MSCVCRRILWTTLFVITCAAPLPAQQVARVLVLHSYNTDYQWTRDLDAGIRQAFAEENDRAIIAYTEYLDVRHFSSAEYLSDRASGLESKYSSTQLDGIIVADDMALHFMRDHRDRLFGPVPLVFAGINGFSSRLVDALGNVTGVVENISVKETLRYVHAAFDRGIRLYILADSTTTGQLNLARVLDELRETHRDFEPSVRVLRDATPTDLRRINSNEKSRRGSAVALLIGALFESDGSSMPFDRARRLAPELLHAVPIVTMWDFYLGDGILGGRVTRAGVQGERAGEMMVEILDGRPANTIPMVLDSPNEWVFDARTISAFGLDPQNLPDGAILINNEPTVWDLYSEQIIAAGIVVVSLVFVVVVLLITVRQRSEAARKVQESLEEKEVLLQEIHHRVKNNLQVISSILSMQSASIADVQAVAFFRECESRVRSMALVHDQFYQSRSLKRISMRAYLQDLVDSVAGLMSPPAAQVSVTCTLDEICLDLDTAIPIGLLVNELVSNAFKYGSKSSRLDVSVLLQIEGTSHKKTPEARLIVTDHGPGLTGPPDTTKTLGFALVSTLADQIGASVAFERNDPTGLRVEVRFPFAHTALSEQGNGGYRRKTG